MLVKLFYNLNIYFSHGFININKSRYETKTSKFIFYRTDCRWFLHFSNTPRTMLEKIFACEYTKRISPQMHNVLIV